MLCRNNYKLSYFHFFWRERIVVVIIKLRRVLEVEYKDIVVQVTDKVVAGVVDAKNRLKIATFLLAKKGENVLFTSALDFKKNVKIVFFYFENVQRKF